MATRVKICGITRVEDALAAAYCGADAVGFVFWQRSARYITAAKARDIIAALPPFLTKVGVYVDPDPEWVRETFSLAGLDLLQFHGNETPAFCGQFRVPYIKAVRVRAGVDLLQYATLYTGASGLLLDTYIEGEPGGTGHAFDWDLIPQTLPLPLILSGGLHPGNIVGSDPAAHSLGRWMYPAEWKSPKASKTRKKLPRSCKEFETVNVYDFPDKHGHFGPYGGVFVAETLIAALDELRASV